MDPQVNPDLEDPSKTVFGLVAPTLGVTWAKVAKWVTVAEADGATWKTKENRLFGPIQDPLVGLLVDGAKVAPATQWDLLIMEECIVQAPAGATKMILLWTEVGLIAA